jgi:hypothetical protein
MALEHKLVKCEPTDPRRCQGPGDGIEGQCCFTALEGTKYCSKHGATVILARQEKKKYHDYILHKWQQRVDEFSASERVTNLHGEVGLLRMQIETIVNQCQDDRELMLYSSRISDLVMKADKLVNSIDKINNRSGNLLNKSAALSLAGSIIDIIGAEVDDPLKIERISNGIIGLVAKMAGKEMEDE